MKTPRLLPVVIAAATALLLFKGIGLVTSGGYVLPGTGSAIAADGGHADAAAGAGGVPTLALPVETTMADTSPTLDDGAPVLPLEREGSAGHGDTSAADAGHAAETGPVEDDAETAAARAEALARKAASILCPPLEPVQAEATGLGEAPASEPVEAVRTDCVTSPVNQHGDALPMALNSEGVLAPMTGDTGSEAELLGRLGERRGSLDVREQELDMRMALVEAAERRLEERTATLKAIEARINALVDQKKAAENQQFVGIVAMYETMKPKEAATIFNQLDMPVLVRVASAMNPRKMAPILARMDPLKAKQLTSGLTVDEGEPSLDVAAEDLNSLPQIIGQ